MAVTKGKKFVPLMRHPTDGRVIPAKFRGVYQPQPFSPKFTKRSKPRGAPKTAAAAENIVSTALGFTPLAPVAGLLGKGAGWLGNKIGTALGLGKYTIKRNSLMRVSEGYGPPSMHTDGSDCIITHREYITDVVSSSTPGAFKINNYYINPGLVFTFPWLSYMGQGFEEYQPLGVMFEFKTTSSDALNSTNTALGTVIMATNYNAGSANFADKQSMENSQYSMSFKPSESCLHPIECDPSMRPMVSQYVRSSSVPSGQDPKTYDLGNFQIASTGMQAASVVIGELWVTYQFILRKPIYGPQLSGGILSDHYYCTGAQNASPMGTTRTLRANSSIGGSLSATAYSFPVNINQGNFLLAIRWTNGSGVTIGEPLVTITNGSLLQVFNNGTVAQAYSPVGGATSSNLELIGVISVNAPGQNSCTITLSGGGVIPGTSNVDLFITQYNNTILTNPATPPVIARAGLDHDLTFCDESDDETEELVVHKQTKIHPSSHEQTLELLRERIRHIEQQEKDNILRVRQPE